MVFKATFNTVSVISWQLEFDMHVYGSLIIYISNYQLYFSKTDETLNVHLLHI